MAEQMEDKMCREHKMEKDTYCVTCNKTLCIHCKFEHPADHTQIYLAELSANMILHFKTRLELLKSGLARESDEALSLAREFDEDKRYLYGLMKRVERMVVQMLHSSTAILTKTLQRNDDELRVLRSKVETKKTECDQSEKLLKQLIDYNAKKDYWQIYQIQDKLKKSGDKHATQFMVAELKKTAIKEISSRSVYHKSGSKAADEPAVQGIPTDILLKKEELKKLIAIPDFVHLSGVSKEMTHSLKIINQRLANEVSYLKQCQNVVYVKNNPDPLFHKGDKLWLAGWILNGRTGKTLEFELLYKGSRDSFKASDFHARCDGKSPTIVFISARSQVFGGYTTVPWAAPSPGIFREDPGAFTFSLTKKVKCPVISDKRSSAIRHMEGVGPTFGCTEIFVSDNAGENSESYAIAGVCFAGPAESDPKTLYADSKNFQVNEVEVYKVRVS
ncbi:MAG: TLD domain-containing protein [Candidatus Pacebacteria bacterium]|nr:TLD domain-containing protein [Candidatus Paceibacterota bacterium]